MTIRRVVVTGNCLSRGLGEAVAGLLGVDSLEVFPEWDLRTADDLRRVRSALADTDLWVRIPLSQGPDLSMDRADSMKVIDAPWFTFPAFHPDVVYATRRSDGAVFRGLTDYHSAIALWAWREGASTQEAAALFRNDAMRALGYDAYWEPSVSGLRAEFDAAGLDFAPFWLRLKRLGVFMHSVNHPRADAIALLAKTVAYSAGAAKSVWDIPIERYLQDYLSSIVWPVYPVVGSALGVRGHYGWRTPDSYYPSLDAWLDATWNTYDLGARDDIVCPRVDDGVYDSVFRSRVSATRNAA